MNNLFLYIYIKRRSTGSARIKHVRMTEPICIIKDDGTKEWSLNGIPHRVNGPAFEYTSGSKFWYLNGKRHREDGPAIEYANGTKEWWLNGERHREDGPAIEETDGKVEYWLDDILIKSKNYDSPHFKRRWQKLVKIYLVEQVMES